MGTTWPSEMCLSDISVMVRYGRRKIDGKAGSNVRMRSNEHICSNRS